jgi:hypothetical protein
MDILRGQCLVVARREALLKHVFQLDCRGLLYVRYAAIVNKFCIAAKVIGASTSSQDRCILFPRASSWLACVRDAAQTVEGAS